MLPFSFFIIDLPAIFAYAIIFAMLPCFRYFAIFTIRHVIYATLDYFDAAADVIQIRQRCCHYC